MRKLFIAAAVLAVAALPALASVTGDYVEVRSADVYTGPCFANSEVGLVGNQAILAWHIDRGSWNGVKLDGRSVVAVVKANATLGDPFNSPLPAKAVLIIDRQATPEQQQALKDMARSAAGPLVANVVRVEYADIRLQRGAQHGDVELSAGNLARIKTRALASCDLVCGNESVYYAPLVKLSHSMPAFTLDEAFTGQGLGTVWDHADKRSAFVGTFNL
jgi:hypothetical protein